MAYSFDRTRPAAAPGIGGSALAPTPGKQTLIQRYAEAAAAQAAAPASLPTAGGGAPLDRENRARIEGATGADLSAVRVHTTAASADGAESIAARAYTVGQDIHFADGAHQPGTADGDRLIVHEVAHTIQQQGGPAAPQAKLEVGAPDGAAEHEADAFADAVTSGQGAQVTAAPTQVSRDLDPALVPAAISYNWQLNNTNDIKLLKVRAFFGLSCVRESTMDLAQTIARYQEGKEGALKVDGQASGGTLAAMRADGFETREWYAQLDARDRQKVQGARDQARTARADGAGEGDTIAGAAISQVGVVNAYDRGDGQKYGNEAIAAYYADIGYPMPGGQRNANSLPQSWCGIFATWCVKTATGRGAWMMGPGKTGGMPALPRVNGTMKGARVGDIFNVANAENHMAVIIAIDGDTYYCVGGNTIEQQIRHQTFTASQASGYWVGNGTAAAATPTPLVDDDDDAFGKALAD